MADPINKPFCVALTGGIASGKTAVSDRFAALGVPVVDTDLIAREVVEPGQPALRRVAETFGDDVLDGEGRLDRKRMREIVFSDEGARERLEGILHPEIWKLAQQRVEACDAPWVLLVIPLLAEGGRREGFDRVLLVDVDEEVQIRRVMARDDIDHEAAEAILAAQASRTERQAIADDIIDNSGSLDDLDEQIVRLNEEYLDLAVSSKRRL